jgi:hypothetical protein
MKLIYRNSLVCDAVTGDVIEIFVLVLEYSRILKMANTSHHFTLQACSSLVLSFE